MPAKKEKDGKYTETKYDNNKKSITLTKKNSKKTMSGEGKQK
jgi:hypothetical protein